MTAGLTVPLLAPEPNTRLAILLHLAETRKIDLPVQAAKMLAEAVHGTVPMLMGPHSAIRSAARRDAGRIDVRAVRAILEQRGSQGRPSLHAIGLATAKFFGLKLSELRSPSRQQAVVAARNMAVYLARDITQCSFAEIGQYFGGRDHTTVMHSWRKMERLLKTDPAMSREVEELKRRTLSKNNCSPC